MDQVRSSRPLVARRVVVTPPASRTNNAGTTATFFAAGGGTPTLTYQWLKNGVPLTDAGNISGAGTPTLTLSNVLGSDAGSYALMVSNAGGSITSSAATLSVIEPIITLQPANQFADAGQSANFTVAAIGSAPFTYQWRKNGTNISAPNLPTLTLTNVSGADLGTYSVLVSTPYGSAASSNATLTINFAVPDSLSVNAGGDVRAMAVQPDGKILIGGSFTNLGGQPRNFIGRLNPDGSLDPDFNPGADNIVNCFAVQPDGKILVGGYFQNLSGQISTCIARLYADGTLDTNFAPSVSLGGTPFVNALAVQPDGKSSWAACWAWLMASSFPTWAASIRMDPWTAVSPAPSTALRRFIVGFAERRSDHGRRLFLQQLVLPGSAQHQRRHGYHL